MAGGVDISAAGGSPPASGGLKPLITALDKYQQQLNAVSRALEEATALAGSTTASSAAPVTTIVQKAQPTSVPLPQPKVDPRYNPDLDYALGIGPKPELPAPIAAPVLPEAAVAPQLPQPVLPTVPVTDAPTEEPEADPIKNVMDQFGDAFKGIGAELTTALTSLSGIFNTIGVEAKLLAIAAEAVAIVLEPLEQVTQQLSEAIRPVAEALATLIEAAITPMVTALKVVGKVLEVLVSPVKILAGLLKIFSKIVEVILSPFKLLEAILTAFGSIVDAVGEVIETMAIPVEMLADWIVFLGETIAGAIGWIAKLAKSAKNSQTAIFDAFRNVKTTVADLIINPMGAIPELMGRIREAVDTFNPGAMIEFDLAMRDLMAVFGEALLPVIKTVTGVIRKFADTLRPILQALAPAFQKLIDSIGGMLLGNIDKFSQLLERMIPAFEAYLNQVIAAVDRQNAIDQQSKANDSTVDDATSWIANWFRTTDQIAANAKQTKAGKDVIKQDVNRVVGDPMANLMMGINGIALPIETLQKEVDKQMADIAKERIQSRKEGTNTGEKEAQRRANENMLESAVEMSKMRTKFLESNKPGKDKADALGKGGGVEMSLDAAIKDLEKARVERAQGKITPEQMAQSMDRVTEAQKFATEKMGEFLNKPNDPKGAAQGLAAAQNPAFKSIADLSRDTILKAFTATSSEAQMKEQQNKKAVDNVANLPAIIAQGVQAGMAVAMKDAQQVAPAAPQAPAFPIPQVA
jgi:hypothetical protein